MWNRCSLAAALLIILVMGAKCEGPRTISDELIGVWRTRALNYTDSTFELGKDRISFGTKTGEVFNYAITKVDREQDRRHAWILYTVQYIDDSSKTCELPFYYQPSGQATITFKNKPNMVWTKDQS